jgi:hypothetical protein
MHSPTCRRARRLAAVVAIVSATLASAAVASADLGPPPGVKRIPFSFTVKGLSAAPDRVLFAYPCGMSNGAPIAELRKIEDGVAINVGRRGGGCPIYSVDKAAYETWAKDYKPSSGSQDPAAEKLVAQSVKCTGGPTPSFEAASTDARTAVHEKINVVTLDAKTCVLKSEPLDVSSSSSTPAAAPSAAPPATVEPGSKSSRGCALGALPSGGGASDSRAFDLVGLVALAGVVAVRRRRSIRTS